MNKYVETFAIVLVAAAYAITAILTAFWWLRDWPLSGNPIKWVVAVFSPGWIFLAFAGCIGVILWVRNHLTVQMSGSVDNPSSEARKP